MANNILKALINAGDAFMETLNSGSQENLPQPADELQSEQGSNTSLSANVDKEDLPEKDGQEPTVVEQTNHVDSPKEDNDKPIASEDHKELSDSKQISSLDTPEIRLTTSEELASGGYVLGFSIQGRSHIMSKMPCQDYHAFEDLKDGWLLAITSDGAGSAREAARGSKANCELASRLVKQLLAEKKWKERNYLPTDKEWYIEIKNVFEVMQAIIMRSASSQIESYKEEQKKRLSALEKEFRNVNPDKRYEIEKQIKDLEDNLKRPLEPRDFNATIVLLLISPQGMMAAHIGDGRMGYLSRKGEWIALMTPHKGDEASSTVFIPNNWNRQLNVPTFTMSDVYLPDTCVVREVPKAFVLMSDGCESFSWTCKRYDPNRNFYYDHNVPYEKFFNPLIDQLGKIDDKAGRIAEMIDIINVGTTGGKKELDDRTMLLGVME